MLFHLMEKLIGCSNPQIHPSSSCPSSYCPISLLSLVSKILERHVFNLLHDFVIPVTSYLIVSLFFVQAFPQNLLSVLSVIHFWSTSHDKGKSIQSVFFDLSKAFGSVPDSPLINVLSHINLPGPVSSLLASKLSF